MGEGMRVSLKLLNPSEIPYSQNSSTKAQPLKQVSLKSEISSKELEVVI